MGRIYCQDSRGDPLTNECECEYDGEEQLYQCEECYYLEQISDCSCQEDVINPYCRACY